MLCSAHSRLQCASALLQCWLVHGGRCSTVHSARWAVSDRWYVTQESNPPLHSTTKDWEGLLHLQLHCESGHTFHSGVLWHKNYPTQIFPTFFSCFSLKKWKEGDCCGRQKGSGREMKSGQNHNWRAVIFLCFSLQVTVLRYSSQLLFKKIISDLKLCEERSASPLTLLYEEGWGRKRPMQFQCNEIKYYDCDGLDIENHTLEIYWGCVDNTKQQEPQY